MRYDRKYPLPDISWDRLGDMLDVAKSDAVDDLANSWARKVAAHVEGLCEQAREMGPTIRVAISEGSFGQDADMSWQWTIHHQFLEPGAMPSLPGACRVYGPFPPVDSTE
ncbi:hypothetical protein [Sphingobium sp. TCM1]|uniref:hypothetical protein n=1 Tax=Sphingobium sp. TCM1 TaxID=453246 RepID=UPI0007F4898C|nr:hypothetical protein [Sphingobium sp. TCM1]OAN56933.1 hypothetical protein A7Q26_17715 [Sphingobium sp. TCM1]